MKEASWPWLAAYPPGIDWQAEFPEQPLYRFLEDSVERFAVRPCLDFLGKTYDYREVGSLVRRAAKGLAALGVGKDVRVGLVLPNSPYYVILYLAVLEAGGTVVNFNPLYVEEEMLQLAADSGAEVMVTLDVRRIYGKVAALLGRASLRKIVVCPMAEILPQPKKMLYRL